MPANNNSASGKAHGDNRLTFEESFARLQEVVTKLSEGNLTLQEALSSYEEGMALAERCAGMLDGAELRVKQVSERAMRAGSASLVDLDQEMRALSSDEDGLVAIEIETFESTLVFDERPTMQSSAGHTPAQTDSKPSQRRPAPPIADDLDPLFDEDD